MTAPVGSSPSPASKGIVPDDWPVQAADTIVETIGKVRDKTTKPALLAARGLVYGLLAAIVGSLALILVLVLVVRLYANYVPGDVWILYAGVGAFLAILGLWLLRKANRPAHHDD
jgi:hypothetical protein